MATNPQSAYRSWLGVSKDPINANLGATYPAATTTFVLTSVTGSPASVHAVVFIDGNNTETLAVSSWTAGTSTLVTTTGSTFAHNANTSVFFQTLGQVGPTAFLPVTKLDFSDKYDQLYAKPYIGSQVTATGAQQGMRIGNFSVEGDLYADSFGYIANAFFGAYDTAASLAPTQLSSLSATSGSVITASVSAAATFVIGQAVTLTGTVTGGTGNWNAVLGQTTVASVGTNSFTFTTGASVSGSPTVTGASVAAAYAYSFSPQNSGNGQPPAYIFWDYNPGNSNLRCYYGAVISDLSIKMDPAALTQFTCTGMSNAGGVVAGTGSTSVAAASVTVPTPTFSTFTPVAARVGGTTIAGTINPDVLTCEFAFKRNEFGPVNTIQGTQDPLSIFSGPVDSTAKWSLVMADDTLYNQYVNQTQPSFQIAAIKGLGTAANGVFIHQNQANYEDVKITQMGKAYVTLEGGHTAIANTTDASAAGGGYSAARLTISTAGAGTSTLY